MHLCRKFTNQALSSVDRFTKDFGSGPDFVYQTHGLSGKEAHRLDVSGCVDVRRHTGEPLNRYLCTTNDRAADDGFVRPGILGFTLNVWVAGNLLHKVIALVEDLAADSDQLIRVRGMRNIVDREDQDLGKSVGLRFVGVGMLGNFLDDLAIAIWGRNLALNLFGGESPLILDIIEEFFTSFRVNFPNPLAFLQEDAVYSNL